MDLIQLMRLGRNEQNLSPEKLVNLYRFGQRKSPWEDLSEEKERDFKEFLNPDSLVVKEGCVVEPSLANASPLSHFQFERVGYFNADPDSAPGRPVFNRTVALKDSWTKEKERQ